MDETVATHITGYGNPRFVFGYACTMGVILVVLMQLAKKPATSLIGKMSTIQKASE